MRQTTRMRRQHAPGRQSSKLQAMRRELRRGTLRMHLQGSGGDSLDAEDMLVRQIQLAGRVRRPLHSIKRFVFAGGIALLQGPMEKRIRRQIRDLLSDYTLADAVPVELAFPLQGEAGNASRAERYFGLMVIGPRLPRGACE